MIVIYLICMLGNSLLLIILAIVAFMGAMQFIHIYMLSFILHFNLASIISIFTMNRSP